MFEMKIFITWKIVFLLPYFCTTFMDNPAPNFLSRKIIFKDFSLQEDLFLPVFTIFCNDAVFGSIRLVRTHSGYYTHVYGKTDSVPQSGHETWIYAAFSCQCVYCQTNFFYLHRYDGVRLCLRRTVAANGHCVQPPDDTWVNMVQGWNDTDGENRRTRRKILSHCHFVYTASHTCTALVMNPDLRGDKPVPHRLTRFTTDHPTYRNLRASAFFFDSFNSMFSQHKLT